MKLNVGTFLNKGKYRIEKVLGQGSFGITYLATAKFSTKGNLGKMDVMAKVAIKEFFMSDINSRKEDGNTVEGSTGSIFTNYKKRFRKEAENLSKLSHSNIVRVIDVFDENNTTYYVMEYLDGNNLDDYILSKGRIPEREALSIIREIGSALSYMHSRKMLHLDIKPKNVMRSSDGISYLIDFGLSKQYTDDGEPESSTTIGSGTSGYSPLEQSQYKQDGTFPATLDVYALGATLYKMLTGKRPPEASIILDAGFPYDDFVNTSRHTVDVLAKSMSPAKKDRWSSIDEFVTNLTLVDNENSIINEDTTVNEDTVIGKNITVLNGDQGACLSLKLLWKSRPVILNAASILCILFYCIIWLYCTYIFTGDTVISSYGDISELKNLIRIVLYLISPYIGIWGCINLMYGNKKLWLLPIILYLFYIPISFSTGASTHITLLFLIVLVSVYAAYYLIMRKALEKKALPSDYKNRWNKFKEWPIVSKITLFIFIFILSVSILGIASNYHIEYYRFSLCEVLAISFCVCLLMTSKVIGLYLVIPVLIVGYLASFLYFERVDSMYSWIVEVFETIGLLILLISMSIKVKGKNTFNYLY